MEIQKYKKWLAEYAKESFISKPVFLNARIKEMKKKNVVNPAWNTFLIIVLLGFSSHFPFFICFCLLNSRRVLASSLNQEMTWMLSRNILDWQMLLAAREEANRSTDRKERWLNVWIILCSIRKIFHNISQDLLGFFGGDCFIKSLQTNIKNSEKKSDWVWDR